MGIWIDEMSAKLPAGECEPVEARTGALIAREAFAAVKAGSAAKQPIGNAEAGMQHEGHEG